MGVGGKPHAPAALPPGKNQCTLYRRLGESQGRPGRVQKISPPPWFDPRTQANRYTDWAMPARDVTYDAKLPMFRRKRKKPPLSSGQKSMPRWDCQSCAWLITVPWSWKQYVPPKGRCLYIYIYTNLFINCNWVVTRWQYTFAHRLHEINST
jgi:hypothetical protein